MNENNTILTQNNRDTNAIYKHVWDASINLIKKKNPSNYHTRNWER